MANLIDNAMDVLVAKLVTELVDGGSFKAVARRVVNALAEPAAPVLGLVPSAAVRTRKAGGTVTWEVTLAMAIVARSKDTDSDAAVSELLADLDAALTAYNALAAPKGVADMPRWQFWYAHKHETLAPVGAVGTIRLRVDGASLKVT